MNTLRILHLEQALADRERVRRALDAARLTFELIGVATRAEFQTALESNAFDLILADFVAPGFDGHAALLLAREIQPAASFVFVTHSATDEQAIAMLELGATDCIFKDQLERLKPAIVRARREAGEFARRHATEQTLRKTEEALRRSERRFDAMAENAREVFWITSPDARQLLYVGPACDRIWGQPAAELYRRPAAWIEAVAAEDRERVLAAQASLADGTEYEIEFRITRPDGSIRWVKERGFPLWDASGEMEHAAGVVSDITERKELELQLAHLQKVDAIGPLTGGIAHDLNNSLTVINGHAGLMLDTGELSPAVAESLKQILTGGERAASLTRQLSIFSRKQPIARQPIDINAVVGDAAKLLRRVIGEHIQVELALSLPLPLIEADAGMVEQILINLAMRARDAMPRGGRLVVRTGVVEIGANEAKPHRDGRAGRFVCLGLDDFSGAMPAGDLPRIFEPQFTVNKDGPGCGLELEPVQNIAKENHGWIAVRNRAGAGSAFEVFLPLASRQATTGASVPAEDKISGGTETVLLVEDEIAVREIAVAVLQKYGYGVLQASSGVEALEIWKRHAARIELLLTDMVMPDNMTGLELAEKLRIERPGLKVILASGYSSGLAGPFSSLPPGIRFLQKPFPLRTLARTVRETLDRRDGQ